MAEWMDDVSTEEFDWGSVLDLSDSHRVIFVDLNRESTDPAETAARAAKDVIG